MQNLKANSRKLVPKTVMTLWRAGEMQEAKTAAKQFIIVKSNEMVVGADRKNAVTSFAAFVASTNATGVYQHGKFPAGHALDKLTCKKTVGYVPGREEVGVASAVMAAIVASSNASILWVVTAAEGKVVPVGLALTCSKQLVVAGTAVVDF